MIKLKFPHFYTSFITKNQSHQTISKQNNSLSVYHPATTSFMESKNKRTPYKFIKAKSISYQKQKQILEWRLKTQFPIAKVKAWKVISEKVVKEETYFSLYVELQSEFKPLKDIQIVFFNQALYILKEAFVGFERLYSRFGIFTPTASMIMFNQQGYCKVWSNQDYFSNKIVKGKIKSEKEFIKKVCKIIKQKTVKSSVSNTFFENIENCQYFFEVIKTLDEFIKSKNIKTPKSLKCFDQTKNFFSKFYPSKNSRHTIKQRSVSFGYKTLDDIIKNQCRLKSKNQNNINKKSQFKRLSGSPNTEEIFLDNYKYHFDLKRKTFGLNNSKKKNSYFSVQKKKDNQWCYHSLRELKSTIDFTQKSNNVGNISLLSKSGSVFEDQYKNHNKINSNLLNKKKQTINKEGNRLSTYKFFKSERNFSGNLHFFYQPKNELLILKEKPNPQKFSTKSALKQLSKLQNHKFQIASSKDNLLKPIQRKQNDFLRGSIMIDNCSGLDEFIKKTKNINNPSGSLTTQVSQKIQVYDKKNQKLEDMVRTIPLSAQTIKCQFQLEYEDKIRKEKSIRNQFNSILD